MFLTGFMGSGKTSIGTALAAALGWRFFDLDRQIEAAERCTIPELFQERGEAGFRRIERETLSALLSNPHLVPAVIALGGGTFVQPDNHQLFQSNEALTIFLDAPAEELWARCEQHSAVRPLRQSREHFRNLYQARRKFYTRAGVHIQTSGKTVETVAEEIAVRLRRDFDLEEPSR